LIICARIQAHVTRRYVIGYIILVLILFVTSLVEMNMLERSAVNFNGWWYFEIPWLLVTVAAWIPMIQLAFYRRTFVTAELNESERSCHIDGDLFTGKWSIKKKYPQRMFTAQAGSIVLSVLVLLMLILSAGLVHHVWHIPVMQTSIASKANAVQSFCVPVILSSVSVRMWTYWKYPNCVVLLRQGEWLTLQF
jgi:hypothetical protein